MGRSWVASGPLLGLVLLAWPARAQELPDPSRRQQRAREAQQRETLGDPGLTPPPAPGATSSAPIDLRPRVRETVALLRDRARFRADNAVELLHAAYAEVFQLKAEQIDYAAVEADPEGLARDLFEVILALDDRMAGFAAQGQFTSELANAKRRALRAARYLREAVLLHARAKGIEPYRVGTPPALDRPGLAEDSARQHWVVRPEMRDLRLKDFPRTFAILCVGGSTVSAAIARGAAEDNMFSHFALGYIPREAVTVKGKTWPAGTPLIVEALIETGVTIRPLADHYAKGSLRDVVFFVRDRSRQDDLDARMDAFFARARGAIEAGKPLGYDFSMGSGGETLGLAGAVAGQDPSKVEDPGTFFCSGVGQHVFEKAGVTLFPPEGMTRLRQGEGSRELFQAWGIDPDRRVPAPGDADVSPALLRVAEGVVLGEIRQSHRLHAVLVKMFDWMDHDSRVRSPWWLRTATKAVGALNDGPLDLGLVPPGMGAGVLRTMIPLDRAAAAYGKRLEQDEAAFEAAHGRAMTPAELQAHLDEIRDQVDVGTWFRRVAPAAGVYELRTRAYDFGKKPLILLTVEGLGDGRFRVVREELGDGGALLSRAAGEASYDADSRLKVVFSQRTPGAPERATYKLRQDGTVVGSFPDHANVEGGRRRQ